MDHGREVEGEGDEAKENRGISQWSKSGNDILGQVAERAFQDDVRRAGQDTIASSRGAGIEDPAENAILKTGSPAGS